MILLENIKLLKKEIRAADSIFIMGHKDLDLDALGAALGISHFITSISDSQSYIIVDDKKQELGVKKVMSKLSDKYKIIKSKEARKKVRSKSLLIVVDTNKTKLLQRPDFIELFKKVIVIDHHDLGGSSIEKGTLLVDTDSSSTCEMVAELLELLKIKIDEELATTLLSGIMLDTNNYVLKTTSRTFKISYYLTKNGADPRSVQYILKQDLKRYIERQKVITEVKIINNKIALTRGFHKELYRREDLAKIADTLLLFNKIEASFVVGRIDKNTIGISSRSLGNINVGIILEHFGGGGDEHEAAAKITGKTVQEVKVEILEEVKNL